MSAAVEAWADLMRSRPEVERIIWYGSFVHGKPTPRSDVDLCVVVSGANIASTPRHARSADYVPSVATPVPFDIAVLTASEFAKLAEWAPAWAAAVAGGRVIFDRSAAADRRL